MATPASSLQSPSSSGPGSGGDDYMPSQMAGQSDSGSAPPGQPSPPVDPKSQLDSANQQVLMMETQLNSLAKQFPTATPEIRAAIKAVKEVSRRIASNPGTKEPVAPASMA